MTRVLTAMICMLLWAAPATPQTNPEVVKKLREISAQLAALVDAMTDAPVVPVSQTIHVPVGGDLQAAVNAAAPGTTITLDAGAVYQASVTLPVKPCLPVTTITTRGVVLASGQRVDPTWAGRLAVLRSGGVSAAIRLAEKTCGWALKGLEFKENSLGQHEVIELGRAWDTKLLQNIPRQITLTHLLMDFPGPQKRGVGMNSADVTLEDSYLAGFWSAGQDSQAVAGWNTPGPIVVRNNYLSAGSEVMLWGGAQPGVTDLVVGDVLIEGNTLTRPVIWMGDASKVVKNLFEIKAGVRFVIRNNTFSNHWVAAQPGWSIVFTPRNQNMTCPACRVEDILFERNVIRNVSAGFNITDRDGDTPADVATLAQRIIIRDNLIEIDHHVWTGNGRFIQIQGNVKDLHIEYNTILQTGNQFMGGVGSTPATGFRFVGNLVKTSGAYGIFTWSASGSNLAHGMGFFDKFPGGVFSSNAIVDWKGNAASKANLPGNLFVTEPTIVDGYGTGAMAGYGRRMVIP